MGCDERKTGTAPRPGGPCLTRRALDVAGLAPPARLLDVGCGDGGTVAALRQAGYDAAGIDLAPPPRAAHLLRGDAAALPFGTGALDGVLFECSLSKMAAPGRALAEARRVLRHGGALLVGDLYARGDPADFDGLLGRLRPWDEWRGLITAAGFAPLTFEDHHEALMDCWARLVFEWGMEAAGAAMGGDAGALKAARCSYYLACFAAEDGHGQGG